MARSVPGQALDLPSEHAPGTLLERPSNCPPPVHVRFFRQACVLTSYHDVYTPIKPRHRQGTTPWFHHRKQFQDSTSSDSDRSFPCLSHRLLYRVLRHSDRFKSKPVRSPLRGTNEAHHFGVPSISNSFRRWHGALATSSWCKPVRPALCVGLLLRIHHFGRYVLKSISTSLIISRSTGQVIVT